MIDFSCDYNVGAAPQIMEKLNSINDDRVKTYGNDIYCDAAKEKIKNEIGNPDADVWFLIGGTQTNQIGLSALLQSYEGAICAGTGHIAVHEAGAIEATGHKVITVAGSDDGRIDIDALKEWLRVYHADPSCDHIAGPGAVYITHPTEYGGLYSLAELKEIRKVCDEYDLKLYLDGARLAYALGAKENDITMKDLGMYCDAFYIGGTKCGTLLGEALVFKKEMKKFFTHRKQHGGLLAKGWLLGVQFDTLFTDGLYYALGANAVKHAIEIKEGLKELGVKFYSDSKTNQQFIMIDDKQLEEISKEIGVDFWGKEGDLNIVRICSSWKTSDEDVNTLLKVFSK